MLSNLPKHTELVFLYSFLNGQPCVLNYLLFLVNIYLSLYFLPLEGFGPLKKTILAVGK